MAEEAIKLAEPEKTPPLRLRFETKCNVTSDVPQKNLKKSMKYRRVSWGLLDKPACAVCGGGTSIANSLDELRQFRGDIYAVNDTSGYLSDNGIECKLYAIDCTRYPFHIGPLVKGALLASRVHRRQFNLFDKKNIAVFDMAEESPTGIGGGPTAVCRTPHLLLRMGYKGIFLYGFDSCFYDKTHIDGIHKDAFKQMLIVRVNGVDYISNAPLLIQAQFMLDTILKYPDLLINRSAGMLGAMLEHPDTWEVIAVSEDLKQQYERAGVTAFRKEYKPQENRIWQRAVNGGMQSCQPQAI